MTAELLPCPFCGKQPMVLKVGENRAGEMIECLTDGCVGPHVSYYGQNTARNKWNKRSGHIESELNQILAELTSTFNTFGMDPLAARSLRSVISRLQNLLGEKGEAR